MPPGRDSSIFYLLALPFTLAMLNSQYVLSFGPLFIIVYCCCTLLPDVQHRWRQLQKQARDCKDILHLIQQGSCALWAAVMCWHLLLACLLNPQDLPVYTLALSISVTSTLPPRSL